MTKIGLEIFENNENLKNKFRGKRIALFFNHASINKNFKTTFEVFLQNKLDVKVIFAPEHGIYGAIPYMKEVLLSKEPKTGIPIVSLYGKTPLSLFPPQQLMKELDILVCDIQDVGCRYYTYISTMKNLFSSCMKEGVEVFVFDRPNPVNGNDVEGNIVDENYFSFVSSLSLPQRHGMSVGELSLFMKKNLFNELKLTVVPCEGLKRDMYFELTGLEWIMPSPNMPSPITALLYPGVCLLEGTNMSEGRGTTKPFEIIGAPWIKDPWKFISEIEKEKIYGAKLRPLFFIPNADKWMGEECGGMQIHIVDKKKFRPVYLGLAILRTCIGLYPQYFKWRKECYEFETERLAIDLLLGDGRTRALLENGVELEKIYKNYNKAEEFLNLRKQFLLYE